MKMLPSKKHWMTVFAAAALCLATGTALADDGRRVGGYQMTVGWVDEPAYAGIKNGVELRVTRMAGALDHHAAAPNASGTTDMAMSQHHSPGETQGAGTGNGMAMSGDGSHGSGHGAVEAASPMSVSVMAAPDPVGGVNVHIQPRGFTFTPENADMPHVEGEGHAHIYVDGKKVGRAYTPWMHVGGVSPGEHTVRVTLNSNSHGDYTVNGKVAEATAQINIPDEDSGSHGHIEPVAATKPMEVSLEVKPDASGGANIALHTTGFSFAPENVNKENVPGEGHAHIYVNDVKRGRLYGSQYHLGSLEDGMNRVRVILNSNLHQPYTWNGEVVQAEAVVNLGGSDKDSTTPDMQGTASQPGGEGSHHRVSGTGGEGNQPSRVTGLEGTLQVKVTHIASGVSKTLVFHADRSEPGRYLAPFVPSEPGGYQFRVFGAVEREPVNEYFNPEDAGLGEALPAEDLQLTAGGRTSGSTGWPMGLSIAGLVLGGAALAAAAASLVLGMRRRRAG